MFIPIYRSMQKPSRQIINFFFAINQQSLKELQTDLFFQNISKLKKQIKSDISGKQADGNGVFTYAAPVEGWWGFAALNTSDKKMMHDNEEKEVELGAVLWVKFEKWQEK